MATSHVLVLEVLYCANCGLPFGITDAYERRRREDHAAFYCPAGHNNFFPHKTEAEKLREQLADARNQLAAKDARLDQLGAQVTTERRKATTARNKLRRVEARVAHGVCPCCNRTFQNLARHMASKHPEAVPAPAGQGR